MVKSLVMLDLSLILRLEESKGRFRFWFKGKIIFGLFRFLFRA
jgi:hypothetical protein